MKKSEIQNKILRSVIALESSKGHLKWKISELARIAKVSRPLVYYHFGKTKEEILRNCVERIAIDYFGLGEERSQTLKTGKVIDSLLQTREMFVGNPALVVFYQRWRMQSSPLKNQLVEIERRYQAKIHAAFPHLSRTQVVTLHSLFHGLITAPFSTEDSIRMGCEICLRSFK